MQVAAEEFPSLHVSSGFAQSCEIPHLVQLSTCQSVQVEVASPSWREAPAPAKSQAGAMQVAAEEFTTLAGTEMSSVPLEKMQLAGAVKPSPCSVGPRLSTSGFISVRLQDLGFKISTISLLSR